MRLFAIDLRSLALFRIALGALLIADTADRFAHWRVFFTDAGPWPTEAARATASWSLAFLSDGHYFIIALFVAQCLAALCLASGWRTRVAAVASWLLLVSVHARNGLILHGGDMELRLLLFWSMALPLGARWSLDARRRGDEDGDEVRSVAGAALLLQVALVYVSSALLKSDPAWWRHGTAVSEALRIGSYTRDVADTLLAWPAGLRALTYATLALELLGPVLVFVPWRSAAWRVAVPVAFMVFHAALGVALRLGLFPFIGVVGWLPFLPGALWSRTNAQPTKMLPPGSRVLSAVVAVCFALAVMCATRPWFPSLPPWGTYRVARLFRLDQRWDLFAPRPLQTDGWFVVEATLSDARVIDLLTGEVPRERAPGTLRGMYPSTRWRRFYASLRRPERDEARRRFVRWLRERYELAHPTGPRVVAARLVRETVSIHDRDARDSEALYAWPEDR